MVRFTNSPAHVVVDLRFDAKVHIRCDTGDELLLVLDPPELGLHGFGDAYTSLGLQDLAGIFTGLQIHKVILYGDIYEVADPGTLRAFLASLPQIREFGYPGGRSVPRLLNALADTPLSATRPRVPLPPLCPKLEDLWFEDAEYQGGEIQRLVAVLSRRAFFKCAPTVNLDLYFELDIDDLKHAFETER